MSMVDDMKRIATQMQLTGEIITQHPPKLGLMGKFTTMLGNAQNQTEVSEEWPHHSR